MKSLITQALSSAKGANKTKAQRILDKLETHPRMWQAVQTTLRVRYERRTGKDALADPQSFLDWLIKNLPAILTILAALLALI